MERRTRLLRNINRLRVHQNKHSPGALQFLASMPPRLDGQDNSLPPLDAEHIPLLPPSQLPAAIQLPPYSSPGLTDVERRLRDAQCRKSLNELRHNLIIQRRLHTYKKQHARNQGATSRSRGLMHRQQLKINLNTATYQHAWTAKLNLGGGDESTVGWRKLLQSDVRMLEDLDDAKKKRIRLAKPNRSSRGQEILRSKEGAASAGESRRLISWIWVAAESGDGFSTNEALHEGLRIEWCKAYA